MRILALTILAAATMFASAPARAQTYDPNYPVCLHVYGRVGYIDCGYYSLAQCNVTASGRSAMCEINPYFAGVEINRPAVRHHRRHYHGS
jgi:hypothetical protein